MHFSKTSRHWPGFRDLWIDIARNGSCSYKTNKKYLPHVKINYGCRVGAILYNMKVFPCIHGVSGFLSKWTPWPGVALSRQYIVKQTMCDCQDTKKLMVHLFQCIGQPSSMTVDTPNVHCFSGARYCCFLPSHNSG